jgi:hypothetical protein
MEYSKISDLEFEGINHGDYPKYVDAFVSGASYDGKEMTEKQLDELNNNSDLVHELLTDYLN